MGCDLIIKHVKILKNMDQVTSFIEGGATSNIGEICELYTTKEVLDLKNGFNHPQKNWRHLNMDCRVQNELISKCGSMYQQKLRWLTRNYEFQTQFQNLTYLDGGLGVM